MEFQELMRERFVKVIEDATGRRVTGFLSRPATTSTSSATTRVAI
jgi:hypothetical protein